MRLLVQPTPTTTDAETLYAKPASTRNTVIAKIVVSKRVSGNVKFSIFHSINGSTFDSSTVLEREQTLTNSDPSRSWETMFVLDRSGEALGVQTDTPNGITISVYGVEGFNGEIPLLIGRGWSSASPLGASVDTPGTPTTVSNVAADAGVSSAKASADHTHAVSSATAIEITDSTSGAGSGAPLALANHQHAHGNRGGGTLHAEATGSVAGFMSAADKTLLDQLADLLGPVPFSAKFSGGSMIAIPSATGFEPWTTPSASLGLGIATFPPSVLSYMYYLVRSDPRWDGGNVSVTMAFTANDSLLAEGDVLKLTCNIRSIKPGEDIDVAFAGGSIDVDLTIGADIDGYLYEAVFEDVVPEGSAPAGGDYWLVRLGRNGAGESAVSGSLLPLAGSIDGLGTLLNP